MVEVKPKPKRRRVVASVDASVVGTKMGMLITPEQIAKSGTEHGHQAAIFQWVAIEGRKWNELLVLLFAIPNGGERSQSVAASLKAEGVRPGVPDMCWPVPVGVHHGLWIELKRPGLEGRMLGGRSDKQRDWHVGLRKQGYAVATAYGWQAACWVLKLYYDGQLEMPDGGDCFFAPATDHPPVVRFADEELGLPG